MKKNEIRLEKVECQVNPMCDVMLEGFRYGAGTQLSLPYQLALQLGKEGKVTLLVPNNPVPEED